MAEGSGEIALDKRPTKPIERQNKELRMKLDFADYAESAKVAAFLRAVADSIEHRQAVELIIPLVDSQSD